MTSTAQPAPASGPVDASVVALPDRRRPVIGSLCTGYAGLDLGLLAALGTGRIAWVADPDRNVTQLLDQRLPGVPNLGDITRIDWTTVEPVDVITAGFPCQDISSAGQGAGIQKGNRSGLWHHVIAAVRVLRPTLLLVENVAALRWRGRGLGIVLGELAEAGYDTQWTSIRASDIGAPHRRERVFLAAWPRQRSGDILALAVGLGAATHPASPRLHPLGHQPGTTEGTGSSGQPLRRRDPADGRPADPPCGPATAVGPHIATDSCGLAPERRGKPSLLAGPTRPEPRAGIALRDVAADRDRVPDRWHNTTLDWGPYTDAIRHWEHRLGRPAPDPAEPRAGKRPRLSPAFTEWLMGLPTGWVTDSPLSRAAQLHALGNGVVPQQAAHAVTILLAHIRDALTDDNPRETRAA